MSRVEKRVQVKIVGGLHFRASCMIAGWVRGFPEATAWMFGPDGEGVEWPAGNPNRVHLARRLLAMNVAEGAVVTVRAEGLHAGEVVARIEDVLRASPSTGDGAGVNGSDMAQARMLLMHGW